MKFYSKNYIHFEWEWFLTYLKLSSNSMRTFLNRTLSSLTSQMLLCSSVRIRRRNFPSQLGTLVYWNNHVWPLIHLLTCVRDFHFVVVTRVTLDPLDQNWEMTPWWKQRVVAVLRDWVLSWSKPSRQCISISGMGRLAHILVKVFCAFPNSSRKTTPSDEKMLQKGQSIGQLFKVKNVEFASKKNNSPFQ